MLIFDNHDVHTDRFPDGTLSLRLDLGETPKHKIVWNYESDVEMAVLLYVVRHLKSFGHSADLYMPYIPNARMDRVKNSDEIFTLKYFAEFINYLEFENVYVLDPHSNVSAALFHNLHIDSGLRYIQCAISRIDDDNLVMYYPDEGAMKRYSELIADKPYAFGIKRRDWRSGNILGITLVNEDLVKGKNILIVDDICSKGGTFYHSAKALKSAGANDIYLYVSHCENTIFKGELIDSDLIKHIYTTKSLLTNAHDKITTIDWSDVK